MTIIGFNFKKIHAEKSTSSVNGKVNIANNVSVKNVEATELPVGTKKQKALKFTYEYITTYEPNLGSINIEGDVLYLAADGDVDKTLQGWKKNKKIDKEILTPILNTILTRCSIKGLLISQDLNLPSPLQLPKVTVK